MRVLMRPVRLNQLKEYNMSKLAYITNLLYTVAFLYSLTRVADGHGPVWLGILVLTTIILTVIFMMHCYDVTERGE